MVVVIYLKYLCCNLIKLSKTQEDAFKIFFFVYCTTTNGRRSTSTRRLRCFVNSGHQQWAGGTVLHRLPYHGNPWKGEVLQEVIANELRDIQLSCGHSCNNITR